ncbi:hypothetical protein [Meiothermus hypogaeus]|uniref:DUF4352 domain-containing protein n=2 Tax=Meiothermus hypogaeus TaxID=884155 RepID=A0A511R2Q3_9DEIN|nr:hypothetical protein [Meiothermus hypogaeus]RIH80622.1 hypothetical protein Mhypo_00338 [Meiothermus hypogaeus]GEM83607.1 hypothetical protein MHY01S_17730 [Meiothermus hypogaeus NBRC 106114]
MRRTAVLLVLALAATTIVWGAQGVVVLLNGVRTSDVLQSGGKVYISTEALQKAGAEVTRRPDGWSVQFIPVGGRLQVEAVEGVEGEWISNGTWRIRVSEVQPIANPFGRGEGYAVRVEVRNLGKQPASMYGSGLDRVQLLDADGNTLSLADASFKDRYTSVPPAGGFANVLRFGDPQNKLQTPGRPTKLLALFRSSGGKPSLPHFRIALKGQ